jgi:predicted nuclease with RNAse H fold
VAVGTVVGIDLSGVSRGTKGRTAAARLGLGPIPVLEDLRTFLPKVATDRLIVEWVTHPMPAVVAIDAPLSLPHSVLCQERGCPRCVAGEGRYIARDVDGLAGGMPTVMLAAIAFRGMHLARLLRDLGLTVIETYPGAAYRRWAEPGAPRADILRPRVTGYRADSADECDAIAAALVAADHSCGEAVPVEGADGTIWVPAGD